MLVRVSQEVPVTSVVEWVSAEGGKTLDRVQPSRAAPSSGSVADGSPADGLTEPSTRPSCSAT
jgi:hypothetical protein